MNIEETVNKSHTKASEETNFHHGDLLPIVSSSSQSETEEEPPSKKRKLFGSSDSESNDKQCAICLNNWTDTGVHRACALKCGHLFGWICVKKWYLAQEKRNCPLCKQKSARDDLRFISANKLIPIDEIEMKYFQVKLGHSDERIEITEPLRLCLLTMIFREKLLHAIKDLNELTSKSGT